MAYRIAIVGFGYWGPNYHKAVAKLSAAKLLDFEVTAVVDVRVEIHSQVSELHDVACYTNIETALNEALIDVVIICTPAITHYSLAKIALLHNKHVLVEKPLTTVFEQSRELFEMACERNLLLKVDHTYLHNPDLVLMRDAIKDGKIGRPKYGSSQWLNWGPVRRDVGVAWDLMYHQLYIFDFLLSANCSSIDVVSVLRNTDNVEEQLCMKLEYPDITNIVLEASWCHSNKHRKISITGDIATIEFDELAKGRTVTISEGLSGEVHNLLPSVNLSPVIDLYPLDYLLIDVEKQLESHNYSSFANYSAHALSMEKISDLLTFPSKN